MELFSSFHKRQKKRHMPGGLLDACGKFPFTSINPIDILIIYRSCLKINILCVKHPIHLPQRPQNCHPTHRRCRICTIRTGTQCSIYFAGEEFFEYQQGNCRMPQPHCKYQQRWRLYHVGRLWCGFHFSLLQCGNGNCGRCSRRRNA